jgi:hypothetical protein
MRNNQIEVAPGTELGNVIMKCVQCLLLMMLPLLFFSCNEKAKTLKPVSSKIEGPLNEYFEVVDRDYKIIGNHVNIEFERIKEGSVDTQIIAVFLDDKGNEMTTSEVNMNNSAEELSFLLANKVGESSTICFTLGDNRPTQVKFSSPTPAVEVETITVAMETEREEVLAEDIVEEDDTLVILEDEFAIDDEMEEDDDEDDDEDEDEDEGDLVEEIEEQIEEQIDSFLNSGSRDWDKVLDDYESYVDQYLSLIKKANKGDLSAMTEYMKCMEKAEKLEKELDEAQGDLSVAQLNRLNKINQKMINGALEMQSWN